MVNVPLKNDFRFSPPATCRWEEVWGLQEDEASAATPPASCRWEEVWRLPRGAQASNPIPPAQGRWRCDWPTPPTVVSKPLFYRHRAGRETVLSKPLFYRHRAGRETLKSFLGRSLPLMILSMETLP